MAGRGTDIKLTDDVRQLGGLCVYAVEWQGNRRAQRQLVGRPHAKATRAVRSCSGAPTILNIASPLPGRNNRGCIAYLG